MKKPTSANAAHKSEKVVGCNSLHRPSKKSKQKPFVILNLFQDLSTVEVLGHR